ncbi:MAG: hypothetical protein V1885_02585 [Candidatus Brennerbacteria bacterium]
MIIKKMSRAADEMQTIIKQSKRKLLEFEVLMSFAEIKAGKFETVKNARSFLKGLK